MDFHSGLHVMPIELHLHHPKPTSITNPEFMSLQRIEEIMKRTRKTEAELKVV